MWPPFQQCAGGKHCFHDRGEGGPSRPSMIHFLTGGLEQILAIEDYPYAEINFSRDPDMPVPPGAKRGELGMFFFKFF
jgi:hypothetical protein